jgi:hypothetical protein
VQSAVPISDPSFWLAGNITASMVQQCKPTSALSSSKAEGTAGREAQAGDPAAKAISAYRPLANVASLWPADYPSRTLNEKLDHLFRMFYHETNTRFSQQASHELEQFGFRCALAACACGVSLTDELRQAAPERRTCRGCTHSDTPSLALFCM